MALAEEAGAVEQQCEACYVIGSLYINKNRWSDPIDEGLYRTAGEWLDRGQALADSCDLPRLRRNGYHFSNHPRIPPEESTRYLQLMTITQDCLLKHTLFAIFACDK